MRSVCVCVVGGVLWLALLLVGVTEGQQPASPDEQLTRCEGMLHAAQRSMVGAQESSGEIAVQLRRVETRLASVTQERDALKKRVDELEKAPAGAPPTN